MHMPPIDSSLILIIAFVIFILVSIGTVLVLWIAMPFSVFGVKGLLRRLIEEQEKTNALIRVLIEERGKEKALSAERKEDRTGQEGGLH